MNTIIDKNNSFKGFIYVAIGLDGFATSLYKLNNKAPQHIIFLTCLSYNKIVINEIVNQINSLMAKYLINNHLEELDIYIHSDNNTLNYKVHTAIEEKISLDNFSINKSYIDYNRVEQTIDENKLKSSHKLFANYIDEDLIKTNQDIDRQKLLDARRSNKYESLTLHALIRGAIHAMNDQYENNCCFTGVEVDSNSSLDYYHQNYSYY